MITYTYDLDITPGAVPLVINLKQYETGQKLKFNLKSRLGNLAIDTVTDCSVRGTKPDGNGYSVTASYTTNLVTVTVDAQMTAAAGKAPFELTLTESAGKTITATFWLDIQRAALDKDTIPSSSEIRELINIIDKSDELIDAATTIKVGNTEILNNLNKKVNTPTISGTPAYGTAGQLLATNGDGTTSWTDTIATDTTLTIPGAAADAKATGAAVSDLKNDISDVYERLDNIVQGGDYLFNDSFSKSHYISSGQSNNQNVVIDGNLSCTGGSVLYVTYEANATVNPSIFSSLLLQCVEYDANNNVLKRTFKFDNPLTLQTNTTHIALYVTYTCNNTESGYTEIFTGNISVKDGDLTLNEDIVIPQIRNMLGTDGEAW